MTKLKFRMTYDKLIWLAGYHHRYFLNYKSDFVNFSQLFDDPFSDNLLNLIEEIESYPTTEEFDSNSTILSNKVNDDILLAKKVYMKLIWNVKMIYPNDVSILNVFGYSLYKEAGKKPMKLLNLLEIAYKNANVEPYNSDLRNAGFEESDILEIQSVSNLLDADFLAQQDFIQGSYNRTDKRKKLMNSIWEQLVKINRASKIIFADSPAIARIFALYK